jgi:hypothetical protein
MPATAAMKSATVKSTTMKAAATVAAAMTSAKTHVSHEATGGGSCGGCQTTRTDRRHRFGALTRRRCEQQHRCRCKAKPTRNAAPWICSSHRLFLPELRATESMQPRERGHVPEVVRFESSR